MFDLRSIGVIALSAALCLSADCAQAFDDATYPDLKGQWDRFIVRGINGQFDQTKPLGRGQAMTVGMDGPADEVPVPNEDVERRRRRRYASRAHKNDSEHCDKRSHLKHPGRFQPVEKKSTLRE